jgi:hypothetical protein
MNTTRMRTTALTATLLAGALALAGCGNGDDETTTIGGEGGVVTSSPAPDQATDDSGATGSPTAGDDGTSTSGGGGADAVPGVFRDDDAELDVEDQSGDGSSVRVEEVQLSRTDGFLAIFTEDGDTLLGHAAVERSDDERSLEVPLDQPLTETARLVAVLHADDGDGTFDPSSDSRVTDDDDDDDDDDVKTDRFTYRVQ